MNGFEVLVPLAGMFCVFGLPVLAFVFFRMLAHRERMAMIRNGLMPGPLPTNLQAGAIAPPPGRLVATGGSGSTLRRSIVIAAVGLALTIGLSFIGCSTATDFTGERVATWHPGPWLLGGLVPLFVGLAKVAIALLSGESLRPAGASPYANRESAAAGTTSSTDAPFAPYDTSYTYRPGSTRELRSPPSPPERRA